jgi:hypothetical protein
LLAHPPTPADRLVALSGLASFLDPAMIHRTLDLSLTDAVRLQDSLRLIYRAWMHPLRRPAVTQWVHENWDAIRGHLPEEMLSRFGGMVGGACTDEALMTERSFFENRLSQVEGSQRGLMEAIDQADQCIAFRARERDRLHHYLAR